MDKGRAKDDCMKEPLVEKLSEGDRKAIPERQKKKFPDGDDQGT